MKEKKIRSSNRKFPFKNMRKLQKNHWWLMLLFADFPNTFSVRGLLKNIERHKGKKSHHKYMKYWSIWFAELNSTLTLILNCLNKTRISKNVKIYSRRPPWKCANLFQFICWLFEKIAISAGHFPLINFPLNQEIEVEECLWI